MGRELRLGFAMGGGVSLGTFNGSALAEALKLAILFGGYYADPKNPKSWTRYSRVVVDVFSGASAGAMSLGIMLRSLVNQTKGQLDDAETKLLAQFPAAAKALRDDYVSSGAAGAAGAAGTPHAWEELLAAQVMQDAQDMIWCEEITLAGMLGKGEIPMDLRYVGGLLDRREVDRLARKWLLFRDAGGHPCDPELRPRCLGPRVLYACTLSRIPGLTADAREEMKSAAGGFLGLRDGLTSRVHRDIRVFDLYLTALDDLERLPGPAGGAGMTGAAAAEEKAKQDDWPSRWLRYHAGKKESGKVGSLTGRGAWGTIAATAVASGAFPFAFEPVVLTRRDFELGALWDRALLSYGKNGPAFDRYPFTYVDGGTFNNEPIREAFRLASFLDAQPSNPDGSARNWDFDRRIVFVDPNVSAKPDSMRVGVHRQFRLVEENDLGELDGHTLVRQASVDRLASHVGGVVGAILNEARGVEGDKIYAVRKQFEMRDELRQTAAALKVSKPSDASFGGLLEFCRKHLGRIKEGAEIPATGVSLRSELVRVISEDDGFRALVEDGGTVKDVRDAVDAFLAREADQSMSDDENAKLWLRALSFVSLDITMGLTGKWRDSMLVCVFPMEPAADGEPRVLDLPGGAIQGFAGFMSTESRALESRIARLCARRFLTMGGMIREEDLAGSPLPDTQWPEDARARFHQDLAGGVEMLGDRIKAMARQAELLKIFPGVDGLVQMGLRVLIDRQVKKLTLEPPERRRFEFRIEVDSPDLEIDGRGLGLNDIGAQRIDESNRLFLITQLDWEPGENGDGVWRGPHAQFDENGPHFRIDVNSLIGLDQAFCRIRLPRPEMLGWADVLPYPTFGAKVTAADRGRVLGWDRWDQGWGGGFCSGRPPEGGDPGPGADPLDGEFS